MDPNLSINQHATKRKLNYGAIFAVDFQCGSFSYHIIAFSSMFGRWKHMYCFIPFAWYRLIPCVQKTNNTIITKLYALCERPLSYNVHSVITLSTNKFNLSMTLKILRHMCWPRKTKKIKHFTFVPTKMFSLVCRSINVRVCGVVCIADSHSWVLWVKNLLHRIYLPATNFVFMCSQISVDFEKILDFRWFHGCRHLFDWIGERERENSINVEHAPVTMFTRFIGI